MYIHNCYGKERCLRFSWDERKNRSNRRKHRVSFETAALVFDDPCHISHLDREVEGELRWQTIGMVKFSTGRAHKCGVRR